MCLTQDPSRFVCASYSVYPLQPQCWCSAREAHACGQVQESIVCILASPCSQHLLHGFKHNVEGTMLAALFFES
jgi:hypothetical protein